MKPTQRKNRRTKEQIEHAVLAAFERLIIRKGFTNIQLMELVKEAQIDSNVFYRRYESMDELYIILAEKYDFWLNETLRISDFQSLGPKRFYAESFKLLFRKLSSNPIMQKLLLWELTDNNETTRRTAQMRETFNLTLIFYYEQVFRSSGLDIKTLTAIFISGAYYLVLHKHLSTFFTIDFNSPNGEKLLDESIDALTDWLFSQVESVNKQKKMAQKMLKDGISREKITYYLDISNLELNKLLL